MGDNMESIVPFFHDFFGEAKGGLDMAKPGNWSVSTSSGLVFAEPDEKTGKKPCSGIDAEFEHDGVEAEVSAKLKLRLKDEWLYGGLHFSRGQKWPTPVLQFVCPKEQHSLTVAPMEAVYEFVHPTFSVHARSNFWSAGGFPVHASITTCLKPKLFAGICYDYDALRSGLKSAWFAVRKESDDGNCTSTLSVNGRCQVGFTAAHTFKQVPALSAYVDLLPARNTAIAGLKYKTPCAKDVMLRYDYFDRRISLVTNFNVDKHFDIGLSFSWNQNELCSMCSKCDDKNASAGADEKKPSLLARAMPSVGVKFSMD